LDDYFDPLAISSVPRVDHGSAQEIPRHSHPMYFL